MYAGWVGDVMVCACMLEFSYTIIYVGAKQAAGLQECMQQGDRVVIAWCVHACEYTGNRCCKAGYRLIRLLPADGLQGLSVCLHRCAEEVGGLVWGGSLF